SVSLSDSYSLSLHDALPIFQLLILVFNIRLRNICIDVDIDGGAVVLLPAGPFQLEDRLVEHLAVEIISHCFHMPALCFSKKIPRSEEHTSELQSRFDLVCRL